MGIAERAVPQLQPHFPARSSVYVCLCAVLLVSRKTPGLLPGQRYLSGHLWETEMLHAPHHASIKELRLEAVSTTGETFPNMNSVLMTQFPHLPFFRAFEL